jgi:CRP-like cAMP-binding protein
MNSATTFPIDKRDFMAEFILKGLAVEDLELLMTNRSEQIYSKGEVIFREHTFPSGIFYIQSGKVKIYTVDANGKERIIYVANIGEIIGYHAALSGNRFPNSAATLEQSLIAFIPKEDFQLAFQQSRELSRRLLKTISHEFSVLINGLSLFGQKSVRERLAFQLIVLREKYKCNNQPNEIGDINLSRKDLANLVGAARENVVRLLSEFKQDGILSTKGRKININRIEQLIRIAIFR